MDNNYKNDELDKVLKKVFDDFRDKPSDGAWGNIESQIKPLFPKARPFWHSPYFFVTIAVLTIAGLAVIQHHWYMSHLSQLKKIQDLQNDKIKWLEHKHESSDSVYSSRQTSFADNAADSVNRSVRTPGSVSKNPTDNAVTSGKKDEYSHRNTFAEGAASDNHSGDKVNRNSVKDEGLSPATGRNNKEKRLNDKLASYQSDLTTKATGNKEKNTGEPFQKRDVENDFTNGLGKNVDIKGERQSKAPEIAQQQQQSVVINSTVESNMGTSGVTLCESLPGRISKIESMSPREKISPLSLSPLVKPAINSPAGQWQVGFVFSNGKIHYNNPPELPMDRQRREFAVKPDKKGQFSAGGIQVSKSTDSHWSFESGLQWVSFKNESLHKPLLEYRKPHGHHNDDDYEDFTYVVHAPSGTVNVGMRINQKDTTQNLPQNTPIDLVVKALESEQRVRLPIAVSYRHILWGPVGLFIRPGLNFDYRVSRSFKIDDIKSLNTPFEPAGRESVMVSYTKTPRLSLGFQGSLGFSFQIGRKYSVELAGLLSGDLIQPSSDANAASTSYNSGLLLGISYRF